MVEIRVDATINSETGSVWTIYSCRKQNREKQKKCMANYEIDGIHKRADGGKGESKTLGVGRLVRTEGGLS